VETNWLIKVSATATSTTESESSSILRLKVRCYISFQCRRRHPGAEVD